MTAYASSKNMVYTDSSGYILTATISITGDNKRKKQPLLS